MQTNQNIIDILKKYKLILEQDNFNIEKMFLFGSYAKNNESSNSDIDVCIVSPDYKKFTGYLWQKTIGIDTRIEPHGFTPDDFVDDNPLVEEINKYGIAI